MLNNNSSILTLEHFSLSDKGMIRLDNQDSFGKFPTDSDNLNYPSGQMFVIADGIGGHAKGGEASEAAIEEIRNYYYRNLFKSTAENLEAAFKSANTKVHNLYFGVQQYQKMGTTATCIVFSKNKATIAHVGDSRIYRISKGKFEQLTSDHTTVAEMQKKGILNDEEAKNYPDKSSLNRAIGIEKEVEIDIIKNISIHSGDVFVLCTDGLSGLIPEEISRIVKDENPESACMKLVGIANERGGRDNSTVQVIKIQDEDTLKESNVYDVHKSENKRWLKSILVFVAVLAVLTLGALFFKDVLNLFNSGEDSSEIEKGNETELRSDEVRTEANGNIDIMLARAESYFQYSKFDSAASIYQEILKKNPAHLAALNGVYNIVQDYIKKGNSLVRSKNYEDALANYYKAKDLQPENKMIHDLIENCRSLTEPAPIKTKTAKPNIERKIPKDDKAGEKNVSSEIEKGSIPGVSIWNLDDLLKEDFSVNGNDIKFFRNERSKKVINQKKLSDVEIKVRAVFSGSTNNSSAGILIGYTMNEVSKVEKYFLFIVEPNKKFILYDVADASKDMLFSVPFDSESMSESNTYLLAVKFFGPWIMIYNRDKLVKAFFNESFVTGKVGLYAGANSEVEFSKFSVAPAVDNLKNK